MISRLHRDSLNTIRHSTFGRLENLQRNLRMQIRCVTSRSGDEVADAAVALSGNPDKFISQSQVKRQVWPGSPTILKVDSIVIADGIKSGRKAGRGQRICATEKINAARDRRCNWVQDELCTVGRSVSVVDNGCEDSAMHKVTARSCWSSHWESNILKLKASADLVPASVNGDIFRNLQDVAGLVTRQCACRTKIA